MNKIKFICDSATDLTPEIIKERDITVIPFMIRFGNDTYKDGIDINATKLYELVEETGNLPQTAAISPVEIEDVFRKYVDEGYDIVYLGISHTMSSMTNNARIAAEEFPGKVYIVDSANISSGMGMVMLKMTDMAKAGKSAEEICKEITPYIQHTKCQFYVESLDYLHKGGRCSGASKLFGHIFHVHPIIKVRDGNMVVGDKPRGKSIVAAKAIVDMMLADSNNLDPDYVFVTDSGCSDEVRDYMYEECVKIYGKSHVIRNVASCTISSHCGYGTIGIIYCTKE